MTVPTVFMLASLFSWFIFAVVLPDNPNNPIPRFSPWFIDLCRIIFAASVLVVLYGMVNRPAF